MVARLMLTMFFFALTGQPAMATDWSIYNILGRHKGVKPVSDRLYIENCGECHFAYQPGLLPKRSWEKMLLPKSLEDHFGDNAEMDESDRLAILKLLTEDSADDSFYKRSIKIRRSIPESEAPLKISEVPYIRRKHRKISRQYIQDNKGVRLLSNCNACHTKASAGIYDDDTVFIPNFGRWDD